MTTVAELAATHVQYSDWLRREAAADLYGFLGRLRAERDTAFSMRFYPAFVSNLVAWPAADQDALLWLARRVFNVRVRTMRRDLARAQQQAATR